jgi:hypothetical protein
MMSPGLIDLSRLAHHQGLGFGRMVGTARIRHGLMATIAALIALASSAQADHPAPTGFAGSELRSFEEAALGESHADQHAEQRRAARSAAASFEALSPSERRDVEREQEADARAFARQSAQEAPAAAVGRWTQAPFELPEFAIHAAVVPTGDVIFWGYTFGTEDNLGNAVVWSPERGYESDSFEVIPPPVVDPDGSGPQGPVPAPIYCSGQSLLPSGELLVTGGNLRWPSEEGPGYTGLDDVYTFDPWSREWTTQPSMTTGRWYPTQTLLADGRTLITSGFDETEPGGRVTHEVETFTPGTGLGSDGQIQREGSATRAMELYPHLFVMPDEDVLLAGPGPFDTATLDTADPENLTWSDEPNTTGQYFGGSAVLLPGTPRGSWEVMQIGGYGNDIADEEGNYLPRAATEKFDASKPASEWESGPSLKTPRSYHNTVLLPDRSMVTVGGGAGNTEEDGDFAIDPSGAPRRVEVFNPRLDRWRLGPAQLEDRGYHATAVLLPDGRVLSAGDNLHPIGPGGPEPTDTGEIYSPPYLFKGPRPKVATAPSAVSYGDRLRVRTSAGGPRATKAVLVAPGATTHGFDMHQRVVPLRLASRAGSELRLSAPPSAGVAPPGYYMLFALSKKGVPSVAEWVRLAQ